MHGLFRALNIITGIALCADMGSLCAADEDAPAKIVTEDRPAADVIYKVHVGPYWRGGPVFAEVGAVVADNADAGPVYCRYLDDPATVPPSRLRAEIGCFVKGSIDVPEGFVRAVYPAMRCATLMVTGSYGTTQGHYKRLFDWIAANGLRRNGEIIEVYPQSDSVAPRVKICVPVRPIESAPATASPRPGKSCDALLEEKDYVGAAEVLFREVHALTAARRRWLSGVVDRLKVIRAIVKRRYGAEADDTTALITGVVDRAPDGLGDPPAAGTGNVPSMPDYQTRKASAIHRDLDRLMVRAHLKSAPAGDIHDRLVALLTDAERLLCKDEHNPQTPRPNIRH